MSRRKQMVEKVVGLMQKKTVIRNMGIAAHIDHGKCVSGDTKIALSSGEFVEAKELFERYSKTGDFIKNTKEDIIDVTKENLNVVSLNKETLKFEKKGVSHVWRLKNKDSLLKVHLANGSCVTTTPEHEFLVFSNSGALLDRRADELKNSDFIIGPRNLEYDACSLEDMKKEILLSLARDAGFYVILNEDLGKRLKEKIANVGLNKIKKTLKSPIKQKSFYHSLYRNRYRVNELMHLVEILNLDILEIYDNIEKLNYRKSTKKEYHSSVFIELPKTESEFNQLMYLTGVIWGDGSVCGNDVRVTNEDPEIINAIVSSMSNVFKRNASVRKPANRATTIYLNSGITLREFLISVFELPKHKKAYEIRVPKLVQKAPLSMVSNFVRGYFDTDGSVELSRRAVTLSSASKEMLHDMQLLLMKFGCLATLSEKKSTLFISASNLQIYHENIGFSVSKKQDRLLNFVQKSDSPNRNTDLLPNFIEIIKGFREELKIPLSQLSGAYANVERGYSNLYSGHLQKAFDIFGEKLNVLDIEEHKECAQTLEYLKRVVENIYCSSVVEIEKVKNEDFVYDFTVPGNRNFVANGLVIHNTTLSDNLLSGCGIISEELSGKQLFMDFDEQEQARGITIDAANVSMVHTYNDTDYLINMIDTPGHVDFSGDVTRAMRAVDGVIVVVCAVEGVMPQTKTVISQALKEKVKPILFINKVDRLINELQLDPDAMQKRLLKIITEVNKLIGDMAAPEFKEKWQVDVNSGKVAFGSAYNNWATSVPYMKKKGVSFKDIIDYCTKENQKELAKIAPLHEVVLDMVVNHLPNPIDAQKYRIPNIWHGDLESSVGRDMVNCSDEGKLAMMITKIIVDQQAGEIATARVYSGKLSRGVEVYSEGAKKYVRVQQIGVYMGPERIVIDEVAAGNIVAISGLKGTFAGDTISSEPIAPFEALKHFSEPVVTKAIEPKNPAELPKLIEVMKQVAKEDPSLRVTIDEETGEYLLAGMGELHLEVVEYRIKNNKGVNITSSNPIVVYRETVGKKFGPVQGRSPNKHNDFFIIIEPLNDAIYKAIYEKKFSEGRRKNTKDIWQELHELGMEKDEAKSIRDIFNGNVLIDGTKGIQHLDEVMELIMDAFEQAMKKGPLTQEPCTKVKVTLEDAKLHEDAVHRGPAQVYPAIRNPIYGCMLQATPVVLEPKQNLFIQTPAKYMGSVSRNVQSRRGIILDMTQEGEQTTIESKVPVAEMFGFAGDIRSAAEGHVLWNTENAGFEPLPMELQNDVVRKIRQRKGLDPKPPLPSDYLG